MGMAHRGRLNVLANVVGKSYEQIFREFEGELDPNVPQGSGDVKYHVGATGKFAAASGATIGITLAANPSHLEAVDPVVEGMARAKQDRLGDADHDRVLSVLIHGDAAFAGQGVVAETLNLSELPGYDVGGTVHIVVNNQVGFTTTPGFARSTVYATDIAKAVQAPIFHVNGDDPEAAVRTIRLAFEFRNVVQEGRRRRHGVLPALRPQRERRARVHPAAHVRGDRQRAVRSASSTPSCSSTAATSPSKTPSTRSKTSAPGSKPRSTRPRPAHAPRGDGRRRRRPSRTPSHVDTGVRARAARPDRRRARRRSPTASSRTRSSPRILAQPAHGVRRRPDRLGARRGARVRVAAPRRHARAPRRPGHPARHVQPAALGARRPRHRSGVHAARAPRRRRRAVHDLRLRALGVRRARLRVRLLGRRPRRARVLGSAVRRLRQRRADDHRPVHRRRRGQVGPAQRPRAAAPPRLRGPGPGALLGPARTLPRAVRGGQHPRRLPHHRRAVLPRAAPPGARPDPQAAGRDDAEALPAHARRPRRRSPTFTDGRLPTRARRPDAARPTVAAPRVLHRQVRPRADRPARRRAGARSRSCASSSSTRGPSDEIAAELARYPDAEVFWAQEEPGQHGRPLLRPPPHRGDRRAAAPSTSSPGPRARAPRPAAPPCTTPSSNALLDAAIQRALDLTPGRTPGWAECEAATPVPVQPQPASATVSGSGALSSRRSRRRGRTRSRSRRACRARL